MKYIATVADISKATRSMLDTTAQLALGRVTYLRMLIATTQHEHIADKPVLATLRLVHGKFYTAVLAVIDEKAPDPIVRNAQSNFARTAFSAVFQFVRGGGDLMKLNAETVTKAELAVAHEAKPPSAASGVKRVTTLAERICEQATALESRDHLGAVRLLSTAAGIIRKKQAEMRTSAVPDALAA